MMEWCKHYGSYQRNLVQFLTATYQLIGASARYPLTLLSVFPIVLN